MALRSLAFLTLCTALGMLGCKKEDDDPGPAATATTEQVIVKAYFLPREGNDSFIFGSSYIPDGAGRDAIITRMRFLITDLRLTDASANPIRTFPGKVILWDSNDPTAQITLGTVDAGSFGGIAMTLGLDDANNALAPGDFMEPPLSDQTLYAGAGNGYRFYQLEGRTDANSDGIVSASDPTFSYTCITSAMRRSDQIYYASEVAGAMSTVNIGLDVRGLLNGVDVVADLSEVGAGALNAQLMSNLQTAIEEP
ncbi:MAG: hypothetical protein JNL43_16635 [Flavobacteriales bacterium]|nr:hypothetical protein [Flavobacteriales bacterium]